MLLQNRKPPGVENEILRVRVKSYDKLYDSFSICIDSKVKYDGDMYWWRIDVAPVYPLHEGNFLGKSVRYFATLPRECQTSNPQNKLMQDISYNLALSCAPFNVKSGAMVNFPFPKQV